MHIIVKYILVAISVFFLGLGQYFILEKGDVVTGGILSFSMLLFLVLALNSRVVNALQSGLKKTVDAVVSFSVNFLKFLISKTSEKKDTVISGETPRKTEKKPDNVIKTVASEKPVIEKKPLLPFNGTGSETFEISFTIPKLVLLILSIVLAASAQLVLLFSMKIIYTGILFASAVFLFIVYIRQKGDEGIKVVLSLKKGITLLLYVIGIALLGVGWILLITPKPDPQHVGVVLTTIGIFLVFFALPENPGKGNFSEEDTSLFDNLKFLDHPVAKIVLFGVIYGLVFIGNKFIKNLDLNMVSMVFYGAAIGVLFFFLPAIRLKEFKSENIYLMKLYDLVRFAAVIGALYLAYKGQMYFEKHNIAEALKLFFIASAIFILAFPERGKKEHAPFPVSVEVVYLIAIIAVSVYIHVHELAFRPWGLENDESAGMVSIVKHFYVGQHPIYFYISELWYKIFGYNRIGMRMLGVSVSMIAVPAMYFAARGVFNARVAIFLTTLFAFLRWHVHYGRSGHGTIFAIIATIFSIYFIAMAFQKRDKFNYFMGGVSSGLCWYGVLTGWFVFLAPLLYMFLKFVTTRRFLKLNYIGLIAFLLGFWVFSSTHIHNFFISKSTYFGRINDVSVFSQDPNAPKKNPAHGIVENTKRVLLMVNHMGDSRSRNSGGVPYEKAVDTVTAILFGIGFLYAMYYSRYYLYFLLVMIFYSQAAGSIFSIEAPSMMRAVGTMIPIVFFAGIVFEKVWVSCYRLFGRRAEILYLPLILVLFLLPIVKDNYNQYFNRWIGGHDELATTAGMYSEELGKDYFIFLYTSLYYPGHPPYRIFRWDYKVNSSKDFVDGVKNLRLIDDENYAVFFHYDTYETKSWWQFAFPESEFIAVNRQHFFPQLTGEKATNTSFEAIKISNEEIKKRRGLSSVITSKAGEKISLRNQLPAFDPKYDNMIPYTQTWKGTILIPFYCRAVFVNRGGVQVSIKIDGNKIKADDSFQLARGFHDIELRADKNSVSDRITLILQASKYSGRSIIGREVFELNEKYLYNIPVRGLHAYHYADGSDGKGVLTKEEIVPALWVRGRSVRDNPYITWKGEIDIKEPGRYSFYNNGNGSIDYIIDNKYLIRTGNSEYLKTANTGYQIVQNVDLTKGSHKIVIDSHDAGRYNIYWVKNGNKEPIPGDVLFPDYKLVK